MKTILVINDGLPGAESAAKMALIIAQKANADVLIANVFKEKVIAQTREYVLTGDGIEISKVKPKQSLADKLASFNTSAGFKPFIGSVDMAGYFVSDMAQFIIKNNIWMIVKGTGEVQGSKPDEPLINIQFLLNRVACPVLLVPQKFSAVNLERMVYMADLRYCQIPVIRYLVHLARPFESKLQVAHVSAQGLPDIQEDYARSFFSEAISSQVNYDQLYFNNIKEKNLKKVADVMVNILHTDLIVLVNHQFHFNELVGSCITQTLPEYFTVPVLVFPC